VVSVTLPAAFKQTGGKAGHGFPAKVNIKGGMPDTLSAEDRKDENSGKKEHRDP
jgi:hypothetical protein